MLYALADYEFGNFLALVWALVSMSALGALAAIDLGHRLLPNVLQVPAAFVGFALSVAGDPSRWLWPYLISAFGVAADLFTPFLRQELWDSNLRLAGGA
jgi:prepilin signal peptidase PulO-like enzyme (type II secretory pathway)